ncbi:MAG: hypothetical protein R2731_12165 [Nocardioides sp.]
MRAGVLADFGHPDLVDRHRGLVDQVERRYPRDGIERVLADAIVAAARREPSKAPASSWPADLVRGAQLVSTAGGVNPLF